MKGTVRITIGDNSENDHRKILNTGVRHNTKSSVKQLVDRTVKIDDISIGVIDGTIRTSKTCGVK